MSRSPNALLYRRSFLLALALASLISVGLIVAGTWILGRGGWNLAGRSLQSVGVSSLIASTLSIALAEYYKNLRRERLSTEVGQMVAEVRELLEHPSRARLDLVNMMTAWENMRRAGASDFYFSRKGPGTTAMCKQLESLQTCESSVTVRLMGDTLRVFFNAGNDFTHLIYDLVTNHPNIRFKALILEPRCRNAIQRSRAESGGPFGDPAEYEARSSLFSESRATVRNVEEFNGQAMEAAVRRRSTSQELPGDEELANGQRQAIELRYYDTANMCFLAIFPNRCFTSQYLYADARARITTVELPLLVLDEDAPNNPGWAANAYAKYCWHFDYVWGLAQAPSADGRDWSSEWAIFDGWA